MLIRITMYPASREGSVTTIVLGRIYHETTVHAHNAASLCEAVASFANTLPHGTWSASISKVVRTERAFPGFDAARKALTRNPVTINNAPASV